MTIGSDIATITASSNKLGQTFTFYPKAAETNTLTLGGIVYNEDANGVSGGGNELILSASQTVGGFSVTVANDIITRNDAENVRKLNATLEPITFVLSTVTGVQYRCVGVIVGNTEADLLASTFVLAVNGKIDKI